MRFGNSSVPIPGSARMIRRGARIVGYPRANAVIEVTVVLRPRSGEVGLAAARGYRLPQLAATLGRQLPRERRHLTRAELAANFGASHEDLALVEAFAHQHGLSVASTNVGARTIKLRGTINAFSTAFQMPLAIYRSPQGLYRGRTGPVRVPPRLSGVIVAVLGLDNRPVARPHMRLLRAQGAGRFRFGAGMAFTPIQLAQLYGFPPGDGQGQTIGIIELDGGYTTTDLNTYFSGLGIPTPNISVLIAPMERSCWTSRSPGRSRHGPTSWSISLLTQTLAF